MAPVSGSVFRYEGKRRPTGRAKYRLPDGRQVKKTIGPAWTERGRPAAGYYTKRTAEAWLRDMLDRARAGTLPGMVRTGVTFAEACEEWLRYMEDDLDRKPSTLVQYREQNECRSVYGVASGAQLPPQLARTPHLCHRARRQVACDPGTLGSPRT